MVSFGINVNVTEKDYKGEKKDMDVKRRMVRTKDGYCVDADAERNEAVLNRRAQGPYEYRIRTVSPRECLRLMDLEDADIDKLEAAGIPRRPLAALAGNSIVVSCLYGIFRTMFIEDEKDDDEPTLF